MSCLDVQIKSEPIDTDFETAEAGLQHDSETDSSTGDSLRNKSGIINLWDPTKDMGVSTQRVSNRSSSVLASILNTGSKSLTQQSLVLKNNQSPHSPERGGSILKSSFIQNPAGKDQTTTSLQKTNTHLSSLLLKPTSRFSESQTSLQPSSTFCPMSEYQNQCKDDEYQQSSSDTKKRKSSRLKESGVEKKHSALLKSMLKDGKNDKDGKNRGEMSNASVNADTNHRIDNGDMSVSKHVDKKTDLVENIEKVFLSIGREKSGLLDGKEGFRVMSSLIADQLMSKYLLIPKAIHDSVVGNSGRNNCKRKSCATEVMEKEEEIPEAEEEEREEKNIEQGEGTAQEREMVEAEEEERRKENIEQGGITAVENVESSLTQDLDMNKEIKREVESSSESTEYMYNQKEYTTDIECMQDIGELQTVHNTDGTMKIILPQTKATKNFEQNLQNTENPSSEAQGKENFSALKQALNPTSTPVFNTVRSVIDKAVTDGFFTSSPDPLYKVINLENNSKLGSGSENKKQKFIDLQHKLKVPSDLPSPSKAADPDMEVDPVLDLLQKQKGLETIGIPFTYEEDTSGLDRTWFYCFKCQMCGKTFKHAGTLKVHERSHKIETEEFKCTICGKVCSAQGYLNIHMRTHAWESRAETKSYKCTVCDESFSEKENLEIHERMHEGTKLFHCDICDTSFTRKTQMEIHKRIHTGAKPYKCDYCDKTFRQSNGLKLHLTTHTTDKPFKCRICGGGFGRKAHYEKHMRKHEGIRPYECETCGKGFTDKFNLNMHIKIHKSQKDYVCNVCHKGFNQSTHLKNHMKFHDGVTGHTCEICNERFEQRATLRDHVLEKHRENEEYAKQFRVRRCRGGKKSSGNLEALGAEEDSINEQSSSVSDSVSPSVVQRSLERTLDIVIDDNMGPWKCEANQGIERKNSPESVVESEASLSQDGLTIKEEPVDY